MRQRRSLSLCSADTNIKGTHHDFLISTFFPYNLALFIRQQMLQYTQELTQQLIRPYFQSSAKLRSLLLRFGLAGTAVWILVRYFLYRLYLHPVNKIPGPPTGWFPLLGNAVQILRADVSFSLLLYLLIRFSKGLGFI